MRVLLESISVFSAARESRALTPFRQNSNCEMEAK